MRVALLLLFATFVCTATAGEYHWFVQQQDHFDALNTNTFMQRYTVNDTFWKPGGPVFFYLSGEAGMEFFAEYQENFAMSQAAAHNAQFVVLEHRFYGESVPNGATNFTTENLGLLSAQQALEDAANFLVSYNQTVGGGEWVIFGCSYSAGLAAWFRAKYPDLVVGAVCPSGPVQATLDQSNFVAHFTAAAPEACQAAVKEGSAQIEALLAQGAPGLAKLSGYFNACTPLTEDDVFFFLWNVGVGVATIDQFANNYPSNTLTQGCATLTSMDDKIAAFAAVALQSGNMYVSPDANGSCYHYPEKAFVATMADPTNANRAWWWQKATEFSYLKAFSAKKGSIFFPSYDIDVDGLLPLFGDMFGIPGLQPAIEAFNTEFGGKNLQASNVVFTNGEYDPWSLLSITEDVPYPSRVQAITYQGGHCEPLNPPTPEDPPSLIAARQQVAALIDSWLA